jgi:MoaA/NifB/PqqE/SkfB family radical SAM enzyme
MFLSRRFNRSLAPPDRVSVNVTLRCNLKCTMCTTCYDSPELSLDEIKGIIDQTAAWGVGIFNPLGGEPFMRNDIEEILSYAVARGFYVTVTTNGTLITERRAQRIARIPSDRLHFNFSLDGDRVANDEIRSAGMFDRAIEGYQRLRDADEAAGNARRKILANTILHARNVDRFHAILDEQAILGFDGVQVLNLFRQGDEVPSEASSLWFHSDTLDVLSSLTESLASRAEGQGVVGYRIQNSPENLRQIPRYYRDELKPLEAPCWAGWKELYINADGEAIMCDGALDFLNGRFGNVREQTLQQLWASPALRERRAVVKSCTTPCVQDCYLRQESDSATTLVADATRIVGERVRSRVARMRPGVVDHPDAWLRLELSDVCPCGAPDCRTPQHRWNTLTEGLPNTVGAKDWGVYRDQGRIDFGRGFMGFDVVRSVVDDIRSNRLRFGVLAVRWRGEPLLHPEIEPILRYLLNVIAEGDLAERLCIETDGRFLDDKIAALAAHPAKQIWALDATRGSAEIADAARRSLVAQRHADVAIQTVFTAAEGFDPATARAVGVPIHPGHRPPAVDAVWIRRADHDQFQANQAARVHLVHAAEAVGHTMQMLDERGPRHCSAPSRSPTISWDGKVTLCPWDHSLHNLVGDVVHDRFSAAWSGDVLSADRRSSASKGVPERPLCRDCPMPWSPNQE